MKRFKTKQELKEGFKGRDLFLIGGDVEDSMGYSTLEISNLFGLPVEKHQYNDIDWLTTDNPHPFDSMDIKVRVTPKQSKKIVKKAKKMGYERRSFASEIEYKDQVLVFWGADMDITTGDCSGFPQLTYKQFMNGTVPKKKEFKVGDEVEVNEVSVRYFKDGHIGQITQKEKGIHGGKMLRIDDKHTVYETECKHTTKPKEQPLMYKEWDVKVGCGQVIRIGRKSFDRSELQTALRVMSEAAPHTDLNEFHQWLSTENKLGL